MLALSLSSSLACISYCSTSTSRSACARKSRPRANFTNRRPHPPLDSRLLCRRRCRWAFHIRISRYLRHLIGLASASVAYLLSIFPLVAAFVTTSHAHDPVEELAYTLLSRAIRKVSSRAASSFVVRCIYSYLAPRSSSLSCRPHHRQAASPQLHPRRTPLRIPVLPYPSKVAFLVAVS